MISIFDILLLFSHLGIIAWFIYILYEVYVKKVFEIKK